MEINGNIQISYEPEIQLYMLVFFKKDIALASKSQVFSKIIKNGRKLLISSI